MGRNMLIVAALAALLVGFGVVTGVTVLRPDPPMAPAPAAQLLTADEAPKLAGRREPEELIVLPLGPEILARLTKLELAVKQQGEAYEEMSKRLEPAVQIIDLINTQRKSRDDGRPQANETAAIATGRNVISAQAQVQASARIDTDNDGTGEYGGFMEMSGAVAGRMAKQLNPPVLSRAFSVTSEAGEVTRSGYIYRIFLPASNGDGVGEDSKGFRALDVDANVAETTWCMYAWPQEYGRTGTRTFFVNQGGDILATDDGAYSGSGNGPSAHAAFKTAKIVGAPALGAQGRDGNTWKWVN